MKITNDRYSARFQLIVNKDIDMKTSLAAIFMVLILAITTSGIALAHSGGTNAQGCHWNHKTGEYHCHYKSNNYR